MLELQKIRVLNLKNIFTRVIYSESGFEGLQGKSILGYFMG